MSSSATPYGARPVGTLSASGSFSGKVRHYSIASGYATSIFYGDFVKLVAAGGVEKDTGTTACTPVGIFLGVSYTDPNTSQKTFSQMWTASVVASDVSAYVMDDPDVLFEMQGDGTGAQTMLQLFKQPALPLLEQVKTLLIYLQLLQQQQLFLLG